MPVALVVAYNWAVAIFDSSDWTKLPGFDSVTGKYLPLDLKRWLNDHGIVEEGERLGALNQPATDVDELDSAESRIVAWVNQRGRDCRQHVTLHLLDLRRRLDEMEDQDQIVVLEQKVDEILRDGEISMERKVDAGRNTLSVSEEDMRARAKERVDFCLAAGLSRPADYSHRRGARWFITICAVIEIILNASLLMDVNQFGLVGSTMQMSLISAVNVLFAGWAMGSLLRQSQHVSVLAKLSAWISMVALIPAVGFFNLAVGHYRDSMQAIVNDPTSDVTALGQDALARLVASPIGLDSFQSALLCILGILCFAIASWKWFQCDDPYPGYGQLDRQFNKARSDYVAVYAEVHSQLGDLHKEHLAKLEDMVHQLTARRSSWRETSSQGEHIVEHYKANIDQYQHDLDFLLSAYRSANRNARTAPPPRHFDRKELLDAEILEAPEFKSRSATGLESVATKAHEAIVRLQDIYRQSAAKYQNVETVVGEASVG